MKGLYITILTVTILGFGSCTNWLDVQPKTSIPGDKLFKSESGFKDVLTGFYIKMGATRLYAGDLTYGYLETLSGNYDNYPDYVGVKWQELIWDYSDYFESKKNGIYYEMFNLIANINNFLKYLERNRSVLKTTHYYEIMKGEALGLRAFLHFDLLRMFGPVYSQQPDGKAIPYRKTFDSEATSVLTARQVTDKILEDLTVADTLLEKYDTRIFRDNGEYSEEKYDPFLVERQLRMNTFAVKALMARVYCYKGDAESKQKALEYAKAVIKAPHLALQESYANPILYGEHIFSLSVYELNKIIEVNFPTGLDNATTPINRAYYMNPSRFETMFEYGQGGDTDWRSLNQAFSTRTDEGNWKLCRKYEQDRLRASNGKNIIPLIRLPEMYYIVAECGTPAESAEALNTVRWARGISYEDEILADANYDRPLDNDEFDPSQTYRTKQIMKEIRKEYFAEGVLFYFYKRHNYKTFDGCAFNDIRNKYQWPLHNDEIGFGNNN